MTRISVCMATYNGEKYIVSQIESILAQLSDDDELIISDDSSTDGTPFILQSFTDKRIRVFPDQKFRNVIGNFENALKQARGSFIFLADQDDVWVAGKVDKVMDKLKSADLVVHDCMIVDENLQVLLPSYFNLVMAKPGLWRNLTRASSYIGCCMAFKTILLKKALPFPKKIAMHDFWIAMIAEVRFKIIFINEPLLLYRRHGSNLSYTGKKSSNTLLKRISFRVNTLLPLASRLMQRL